MKNTADTKTEQRMMDCPRCAGTGIYSHFHGVCFRCEGAKRVPFVAAPKSSPKNLPSHLIEVTGTDGNIYGAEVGTLGKLESRIHLYAHLNGRIVENPRRKDVAA